MFIFSAIFFRAQDNYEIIKKIGRGKYSEVYEGINTLTNQRIVIKILKPGKSQKRTLIFLNYSQEEQDPQRNQNPTNSTEGSQYSRAY